MTPTIQLNGVAKFFGNIIALKDISFAAYRGQVTALLGDNGAGKSTLIKILSGVYTPDEGEILIDGKQVQFRSPRDAASSCKGAVRVPLRTTSAPCACKARAMEEPNPPDAPVTIDLFPFKSNMKKISFMCCFQVFLYLRASQNWRRRAHDQCDAPSRSALFQRPLPKRRSHCFQTST